MKGFLYPVVLACILERILCDEGTPVCNFVSGDGIGGTEIEVGQTDTRDECVKLVIDTQPKANGVTYRIGGTSCYAEIGVKGIAVSSSWQACRFGIEKWLPPDTDITADITTKMLIDAGCQGYQYCNNPNGDANTCAHRVSRRSYSMTTCSSKIRYFIRGCCKPTNYRTYNSNYVWCCATKIGLPAKAIHCKWDEWKTGNCSKECGTGTRTNTRTKLITEANGGTCTGQPTKIEECNTQPCPVHCEWNDWQNGTCSKTCGGGLKTNTRTEKVEEKHGGNECSGASSVEVSCNDQECPVDGGLGEWEEWGPCSKPCGGGDQTRSRRCDNPVPDFGGLDCEGKLTECQRCNLDLCDSRCPAELPEM